MAQLVVPRPIVTDAVVIYYSGHGGLTEKARGESQTEDPNLKQSPERIQFILPVDYECNTDRWTGIFDDELSKLLYDTTTKTRNVTYILDCCHASRLGRAPERFTAWPKSVNANGNYDQIVKLRSTLKPETMLQGQNWSNSKVVRLYAAADSKSAWQYKKSDGQEVGIFTDQLIRVLSNHCYLSSWSNIMVEVRALINQLYGNDRAEKPQLPRSAGADTRKPFSMERDFDKNFIAHKKADKNGSQEWLIEGGMLHRIVKGSEFKLTPFNSVSGDGKIDYRDITISYVGCFSSNAKMHGHVDYDIGLARPCTLEATFNIYIPKYCHEDCHEDCPRDCPKDCFKDCSENCQIQKSLIGSKVFKPCEEQNIYDVRFAIEGANERQINLYDKRSVLLESIKLGSQKLKQGMVEHLFTVACQYARGEYLRRLRKGSGDEEFNPRVNIQIGRVLEGKEERLRGFTTNEKKPWNKLSPLISKLSAKRFELGVDDQFYIRLKYLGKSTRPVYVFAFRVDSRGGVTYLSAAYEYGVGISQEIPSYRLDSGIAGDPNAPGMVMRWSGSIPKSPKDRLKEELIFLITPEEADLRSLEMADDEDFVFTSVRGSKEIATNEPNQRYDVVHVPYLFRPPGPESRNQNDHEQTRPSDEVEGLDVKEKIDDDSIQVARGPLRAAFRRIKGTPPGIRVVNLFNEGILVSVSPFRPPRLWSGADFGASAAAVNVGFETTAWFVNPTKKTIPPSGHATFGLPNRGDGFASVSVSTSNGEQNIENDRVPLGSTIYFNGGPDMDRDDYDWLGERCKYRPIRAFPQ
ncbi:hypothetical protein F5Y02DRAFT_122571 [Annulohypoxylon stygium]|nr:hypothetical protein F5Y02DRAFT_122571 [Annulohypoxylon stygium]